MSPLIIDFMGSIALSVGKCKALARKVLEYIFQRVQFPLEPALLVDTKTPATNPSIGRAELK